MKRYWMGLWFACVCTLATWAVPASREPIVDILDDGCKDTVFLHGDEYSSFRTKSKKKLQKGGSVFHAPQRTMLHSYMPSRGVVRVPVLLVNFADYSFTIENPIEKFEDYFNGKGGSNPHATGSVHDYYIASSDSALDLQYEVVGIYTLSQDMEYYGSNQTNSSGVTTNHNIHARELVEEVVELAAQKGVNFSRYDNDNDGYIDNISIIVAGYNEAEGAAERTIWPHYSTINNGKKYSGKSISGYLITSEYRGSGGKVQAGIGTYCHEFGHALGLPDLYDTSVSDNYTVGYWDIM